MGRNYENEFDEVFSKMADIKRRMEYDRMGYDRRHGDDNRRLVIENEQLRAENAELKNALENLVFENFLLHTYFDKAMAELFDGDCPCEECDNTIGIESVEYRPRRTVVHFTDGSKSTVKCWNGDAYDARLGFTLALLKRIFGYEQYKAIMRTFVYDNPDFKEAEARRKEYEEKKAQAKQTSDEPSDEPVVTDEEATQTIREPIGEPVVTAPEKPVAPSDIPVSAIEQEMAKEDKTFNERGDVHTEDFFDEDDDPLADNGEE